MAVLIEAINVVVPNRVTDARYTGGIPAYGNRAHFHVLERLAELCTRVSGVAHQTRGASGAVIANSGTFHRIRR